jgi:ATPase subunit of ABC transporter with duplicated ATPase domains
LFTGINLVVNKNTKAALIGNNGAGKSTLLQLVTGRLQVSGGHLKTTSVPYYVPQHFGQFNGYTVAQALGVDEKLTALNAITSGDVTAENFALLNDDWTVEERCNEALAHWGLENISLHQLMETLSGGQKTKIFLAGISVHKPDIVLLDEPSNHLDGRSRKMLYNYISATNQTLLLVSHDRTLLNLLNETYELTPHGITAYGGNYDFYVEQKELESNALSHELKAREKALKKARDVESEALERQQKLDARGKKLKEKAGLPKILMGTLKNSAERSTSRLKSTHADKVGSLSQELTQLRANMPDADKMKVDIDSSKLHAGKVLVTAEDINYKYDHLHFKILSRQRIAIKGSNGSGKTTLIKLIFDKLQPQHGLLERVNLRYVYIDQEYSLINNTLSVYEQAQYFNAGNLQEHDIKIRLNRFLFGKEDWDKPCAALSGGEKMRLTLCSLTIMNQAPDIIALDEPTNNLDIQNVQILTQAINQYQGTLIVVSHDEYFLQQVNVNKEISLQ